MRRRRPPPPKIALASPEYPEANKWLPALYHCRGTCCLALKTLSCAPCLFLSPAATWTCADGVIVAATATQCSLIYLQYLRSGAIEEHRKIDCRARRFVVCSLSLTWAIRPELWSLIGVSFQPRTPAHAHAVHWVGACAALGSAAVQQCGSSSSTAASRSPELREMHSSRVRRA